MFKVTLNFVLMGSYLKKLIFIFVFLFNGKDYHNHYHY